MDSHDEEYDYFPTELGPAEKAAQASDKKPVATLQNVVESALQNGASQRSQMEAGAQAWEDSQPAAMDTDSGILLKRSAVEVTTEVLLPKEEDASAAPDLDGKSILDAPRTSDGQDSSSRYSDFSTSISITGDSEFSSRRTSSLTRHTSGSSEMSRRTSSGSSSSAAARAVNSAEDGVAFAEPIIKVTNLDVRKSFSFAPLETASASSPKSLVTTLPPIIKKMDTQPSQKLSVSKQPDAISSETVEASKSRASSRSNAGSTGSRSSSHSSSGSVGSGPDRPIGRTYSVDVENVESPGAILKGLTPFVPKLLLQEAEQGPDTFNSEASVKSFTAAVMIADVTGFTPLTERALTSKRGTELVEELTVCMNSYFNDAIEMVLDHGGDVIKFAGDSLIVAFPVNKDSNETPEACALRAAACGYDLVSTLGAYTPQLGGYGDTDQSSREDDNMAMTIGSFRSGVGVNKSGAATKVLVVDDIVLNRLVLSKMLTKLGCEVVLATNGTEAVTEYSKYEYPLIFMDINMPVKNGLDATKEIRELENSPVHKTWITATTAQDEQAKAECIDAGMDGFLTKPVTMAQLVLIVKNLGNRQNRAVNMSKTYPAPRATRGSLGSEASSTTGGGKDLAAPLTLSLKVMVGFGEVRILNVGGGAQNKTGLARWECFMADPPADAAASDVIIRHPIEQVKGCDHFATSGNVILSPEVWALIGRMCSGENLGDGFVRLSALLRKEDVVIPDHKKSPDTREAHIAAPILRALRTYIPDSVLTRLLHNQNTSTATSLAEVRRCTCLFLGLPSLSERPPLGSPSQLERVQSVMSEVQKCLAEADGCLLQMRMDEKGYLAIAAFGLPGNSHQDDPLRAVRTAIAIREGLKTKGELGVAGVTTGKLLCATVGGKKRCEYTLYGDSINLSARLMKNCHDEVLVDSSTYEATSSAIDYVALSPMKVKGKEKPVGVFRPMGLKGKDGSRSASQSQTSASPEDPSLSKLVGREKELKILLDKVTQLRDSLTRAKRDSGDGSSSGRSIRRSTTRDEPTGSLSSNFDALLTPDWQSPSRSPSIPSVKPFPLTLVLEDSEQATAPDSPGGAWLPSGSGLRTPPPGGPEGTPRPTRRSRSFAEPGSPRDPVAVPGAGVVALVGQTGIGKSALISMMKASLQAHYPDVEVSATSGVSGGLAQQVLVPWIKFVNERLDQPPVLSPEQRGQKVLQHLPELLQNQAYLLNDALKIHLPPPATPKTPARATSSFGATGPANHAPSPSPPAEKHNLSAADGPVTSADDTGDDQRPRVKRRFSRKASLKRGRGLGPALLDGGLPVYVRATGRRVHLPEGGTSDAETPSPQMITHLPGTVPESPGPERRSSDGSTPKEQPKRRGRLQSLTAPLTNLFTHPAVYDSSDRRRADSPSGSTPVPIEDGHRQYRFHTTSSVPQGEAPWATPVQLVKQTSNDAQAARGERRIKTNPVQEGASAEARASKMCMLLKHLVLALVKVPCVLVVEDAHDLDEPSWSVLKAVSNEPATPILCVIAIRPLTPDARRLHDYDTVMTSPTTRTVVLKEMNKNETYALIQKRIYPGGEPTGISTNVYDTIYTKTHGHPMFTEQMTAALLDKGLISVDEKDGTCTVSDELDLDTYSFSTSVEALITSRIDLLEPMHAMVLKVASVIGTDFDVDLLHAMTSSLAQERKNTTPQQLLPREQLLRLLEDLVHSHFLTGPSLDEEGRPTYGFIHSVTRDVASSMLLSGQQRMLHLDVAQALVGRDREGELNFSIAKHFEAACKDVEEIEYDIVESAVKHWYKAGKVEVGVLGQYQRALDCFEKAKHLSSLHGQHEGVDQPERSKFFRAIAATHVELGKLDLGMDYTHQALQELDIHVPAALPGSASRPPGARGFKGLWRLCGCTDPVLRKSLPRRSSYRQSTLRSVSVVPKEKDKERKQTGEALCQLASLAVAMDDSPLAAYASGKLLDFTLGGKGVWFWVDVAVAYVLRAAAAATSEEADTCIQRCAEALEKSRDIVEEERKLMEEEEKLVVEGKRRSEKERLRGTETKRRAKLMPKVYYHLALVRLYSGKWDQAESTVEEALSVCEDNLQSRKRDLMLCCLAMGWFYKANHKDCQDEFTALLERRFEHAEFNPLGTCLFAAENIAVGKWGKVLSAHEDLGETFSNESGKQTFAGRLGVLVKAFACEAILRMGEPAEALEWALELVPRFTSRESLCPLAPAAACSLMEVLLYAMKEHPRGKTKDAIARVSQHVVSMSKRMVFARCYLTYFQARQTLLAGNREKAREQFYETIKQAASQSMWNLQRNVVYNWMTQC